MRTKKKYRNAGEINNNECWVLLKFLWKKNKKLKVPESKIWEDKSNEKEGKRRKKKQCERRISPIAIFGKAEINIKKKRKKKSTGL